MKNFKTLTLITAFSITFTACQSYTPSTVESSIVSDNTNKNELILTTEIKNATQKTEEINSAVYYMLDFSNRQQAQFATKGLLDAPETLELTDKEGNVIWSQKAYSFLKEYDKSPSTVNPSLWENSKNNHAYGLFEVVEGIYQVRGYDMANLTLVKGDTGWIVFDPLMSVECTEAAMQLVKKNLGEFPVKAVIISHPHIDHYGGIKGVMDADQVADSTLSIEKQISSGKIPIIVPKGFTEHAVSENVYVGQAMGRRASYQYGTYLSPSTTGRLAMGIGMGQSTGSISFILPSFEINDTGTKISIDGLNMEFQMTPGTEAPTEMNTWFPDKKALWLAENCTTTMHNLYTLRGAQVRDGNEWAKYITQTVMLYGKEAEVTFQSHNWPQWGNNIVNEYMLNTAAVYKFINDQTLTYINQGHTSNEIANMIKLPEPLAANWYTRQYYGTVAHNSKAVYQKYMGWYDANPVNLHPLSPSDTAKKMVEYLGDPNEVLRKAKIDFSAGNYQWVAQVTNILVFDDPKNIEARLLCADALEQLGYQSEAGTWRNAYLTAALELRKGNVTGKIKSTKTGTDIQENMSATMLFDLMGILLDKQASAQDNYTINVTLTDTNQQYLLRLKNGALLYSENTLSNSPDLSITCPKNGLFLISQGDIKRVEKISKIEGNKEILYKFMKNLNQFKPGTTPTFNIIEP